MIRESVITRPLDMCGGEEDVVVVCRGGGRSILGDNGNGSRPVTIARRTGNDKCSGVIMLQ
jgi:hypothetical protein